jgi:hypothetical protein
MGPIRYLTLRRTHLVRRALLRGSFDHDGIFDGVGAHAGEGNRGAAQTLHTVTEETALMTRCSS